MNKQLIDVLILGAAVSVALAIVSRLTLVPILGIKSQAMILFAGTLLLLAIALQGRK